MSIRQDTSVKVLTSKKGVYSGDSKAKKTKVKRGSYNYERNTKKLTFDGTVLAGEVTLQ